MYDDSERKQLLDHYRPLVEQGMSAHDVFRHLKKQGCDVIDQIALTKILFKLTFEEVKLVSLEADGIDPDIHFARLADAVEEIIDLKSRMNDT